MVIVSPCPVLGAQNFTHEYRKQSYGCPNNLALTAGSHTANVNTRQVLVLGCTGYIGRFVTKELINRGYDVTAFTRERAGVGGKKSKEDIERDFSGAKVVVGDVCDAESLKRNGFGDKIDVVVSCLASRTGGIQDSWDIDYGASKKALDALIEQGGSHYVLLSAICVQKPLLEFQRAKLKLEQEIEAQDSVSYSIIRPTAFFKSLAGQVQLVKDGKPYIMFGDGQLSKANAISEPDLAAVIADGISKKEMHNKVQLLRRLTLHFNEQCVVCIAAILTLFLHACFFVACLLSLSPCYVLTLYRHRSRAHTRLQRTSRTPSNAASIYHAEYGPTPSDSIEPRAAYGVGLVRQTIGS
uniref:Divinyl chlorophyllide a 8-vinyl-reductase, chloroplastic n=1 Tax=Chrysotila carterae TaxID=13221 RepID=A0A7S4B656_CHRCT